MKNHSSYKTTNINAVSSIKIPMNLGDPQMVSVNLNDLALYNSSINIQLPPYKDWNYEQDKYK